MNIPKVIASFETMLSAKISASASTLTLDSILDDAGANITGVVGIVVDGGSASEEFMIGTLASDKSFAVTYRGINPSSPLAEVTALKFAHERGASVKITNFPILGILRDLLAGTTKIPQMLEYETGLLPTLPGHMVHKNYVDSLAMAAGGIGTLLVTDAGGITVDVNAGYYIRNGEVENYAGASAQALTDNTINYIELIDGVLSINATAFSDDSTPLAKVTTLSGDITEVVDCRAFISWLDLKANGGIGRDANGIYLDLDATPGLELNSGKLRVKIKDGGGISRGSNGLELAAPNTAVLIAGEAITGATLPVPIFQEKNNYEEQIISQQKGGNYDTTLSNTTYRLMQSFVAKGNRIPFVNLSIRNYGSPTGNAIVDIYANDVNGKPTGVSLGSCSIPCSTFMTGSLVWVQFIFTTPVIVSLDGSYSIVLRGDGVSTGNRIDWGYVGSDVLSGGSIGYSYDSGATWGLTAGSDFTLEIYSYTVRASVSGKVYACDANDITRLNFDGFAITTASTDGQSVVVQETGIVGGFTDLIKGEKYYVQDTAGTIGIKKGTYEMPVGIAASETEIEIKKDLLKVKSGFLNINTTSVVTVTVGFRPSLIRIRAICSDNTGYESIGQWNRNDGNLCIAQKSTTVEELRMAFNASDGSSLGNRGYVSKVTESGFDLTITQVSGSYYSYIQWEAIS